MNQLEKFRSSFGEYRYYKKIRKDGFGAYKTIPCTRRLSIKYYCLECVGFAYSEMANCTMPECPLFPYRFGKVPEGKTAKDRSKAIRAHCMECCCNDSEYIAECPSSLCPVHPFRLPGYKTDRSSLIQAEEVNVVAANQAIFKKREAK